MKIIVFGGNGTLGKELQKIDPDLICPTSKEVNIHYEYKIRHFIDQHQPDIVINAAAIIDNRVLEGQPSQAIQTNIIGAANVANVCLKNNIRLVYISTDYIYQGDRGNYLESDEILPFNFYAWTKLGGECSAHGVKNHLIIRCSFGKSGFSYPQAFIDKWSSKDYVDVIAPMIYEATVSPLTGILNVGTDRKTLFTYAKQRNENVKGVKLSDTNFFTPYDTSLNLQRWFNYKASNPIAKPHTHCRACGSEAMGKYLDLGLMPLANNLEQTSLRAKEVERFPLQVTFCKDCGLSQLSVIIDPVKMFAYYTYRSGINSGYITHCKNMAGELLSLHQKQNDFFHIDIAGNDGTLLKCFKQIAPYGYHCLNVDPASNLAAIAEHDGIPSLVDFWGLNTAAGIAVEHGEADLITATNVFAHVDNISDFLLGANLALKDEGVLVIECPYIIDFIENFEFDTVYFEHLSYMSVLPIRNLCDKVGLKLISVERQNIHGGTIRMIIAQKESSHNIEKSVEEFCGMELAVGYNLISTYQQWSTDVKTAIQTFHNSLLDLKKSGYKIAGYGASAKGNTLLNSAGINTDIVDYIIDSTPEKIGKFSPGTGIPIKHPQELIKAEPDFLLILAWNFKDTLIDNARKLGFKGKFIIPIPTFEII
jgi:hypothetical protein